MSDVFMAFIAKYRRAEGGFSLVEMLLVLLIVAILIVIGVVTFRQMAITANDKQAHADLTTAAKVQELHHLENDIFTTDQAALFDLEPTLRYTADGIPAGTVVVKIESGREETDVCLFTQTENSRWFAVYHSPTAVNRYAESSPLDCTPGNISGWSTESW